MIDVENDEKSKQSSRVKVAIRVRPFIQREIAMQQITCLQYQNDKNSIVIGKQKSFAFDRVFKENSCQQDVYDGCVKQLVMSCFEGYNSAILAYGQTGSGKTYTMGTNAVNLEDSEEMGIIPKVIDEFFNQVEKRKEEVECIIKVSFIEIYNEQIIDLLNNDQTKNHRDMKLKQNFITIREEKDGSVSVCGVNEVRVTSSEQMISLINRGAINRATSTTLMNDSSSRSHGIFIINLEQQSVQNQDQNGFITAKFYFVDLAGSERAKKTGASGLTFREGININLGLLELGNVISALSSSDKNKHFITYRNSKLTRILQDCLGGNSNTYMIACVSPAQSNYEESLNTLKYASKAMNIKNKPVINRDPHSAQINNLKQRIFDLELENKHLRISLQNAGIKVTNKQDARADLLSQQIQRLNKLVQEKQKQIVNGQMELKYERKRNNQLQIRNYEIKRERDNLKLSIECIRQQNPNIIMKQNDEHKAMIDEYLGKITNLQNQLYEQEKINHKLQNQSQKLQKQLEKEQSLLLAKTKKTLQLKNKIKELTNIIKQYQSNTTNNHTNNNNHNQQLHEEESNEIISISSDEEYIEEEGDYRMSNQRNQGKLRDVSEIIRKQEHELQMLTEEQINMEYQLISRMKEQHHKKIADLEREKLLMIKQQNEKPAYEKNPKLTQRIDNLQTQLRELRKKAKQQTNLQRQVKQQSQKISKLTQQIKNFKFQKVELNRKIRGDKKMFQDFKKEKMKDIMKQKRQNIKKDGQIRKLVLENKKKSIIVAKGKDQINRIKKVNETVKSLLKKDKSKNKGKKGKNEEKKNNFNEISNKELDKLLQESIQKIVLQVQEYNEIEKYSRNMIQLEQEIDKLYSQHAILQLQKDRSECQQSQYDDIDIKIQEITQRINNIQQGIKFNNHKIQSISKSMGTYNVETQVIYNPKLNFIQIIRYIAKYLYDNIRKLFGQLLTIKQQKEQYQVQCNDLKQQNEQLKNYNHQITTEHQYNISRLREEMDLQLLYRHINEQQYEGRTGIGKNDEKEKKNGQRKVNQLTKKNRELSADVQMWRRKCSIVQQKYHNMNLKFAKDKFIGRPLRQQENIRYKNNHNSTSKNQQMLEQVNLLIGKIENRTNRKNDDEEKSIYKNSSGQNFNQEYSKNKWQCMGTIHAHNSSVLSVTSYENQLITSATKSMKIWDSQTQQLIADLSSPTLQGFVKCVFVDKENRLILCACEKQVHIFDLRTFDQIATLRAHRDQVRALHKDGNYLYSAGKGSINSGSLFKWDLRGDTWFALQEKQKNLDIFTLASFDRTLYYGTRTHQVRRMNLQTMQIMSPFEPPHMDTVTGLTVMNGYLISGSKDKYLRLWSLDTCTNSSTVQAFNDYINCVVTDEQLPIFYSGARGGQIKMASIESQKIRFIGGIIAHTQSVNSLCTLNKNLFVSGSADRTVKIWKPNTQTLDHIREQYHQI